MVESRHASARERAGMRTTPPGNQRGKSRRRRSIGPGHTGTWVHTLPAEPRGIGFAWPEATSHDVRARAAQPLLEAGVLGPRELPLRIVPARPKNLDGWRFA